MLAQAKRPLIVTANAGRDPAAFPALAAFAERFAIPVVQHRPRYFSLPSSHPMNLGLNPAPLVRKADAILVLESEGGCFGLLVDSVVVDVHDGWVRGARSGAAFACQSLAQFARLRAQDQLDRDAAREHEVEPFADD